MRPFELKTLIVLVRHGETNANCEHRIQGWSLKSHLTQSGRMQASLVASKIASLDLEDNDTAPFRRNCASSGRRAIAGRRFDAIYSSDLDRALETAQYISSAVNLPVVPEPGLREMRFGEWEGLSRNEVASLDPMTLKEWTKGGADVRPKGGETFREMMDRVVSTLGNLAMSHPGKRIIAVTHLGPLRAVLCAALRMDLDSRYTVSVPNCGLVPVNVSCGKKELNVTLCLQDEAAQLLGVASMKASRQTDGIADFETVNVETMEGVTSC
jgi:probable phosphoglycerate mutase